MVEAPTEWDDASPANAAVRWLESDNAAERGRVAYRTTGIAASGERYHVRRQRCTRARAGTTWKHGRVPRVARDAKHLHAAGGKFDGIEFAQADDTSVSQARGYGAVLRRDVARHELRACRGR